MRSLLTTRHVTFASFMLAAMALGGGAHAVTEAVYRYTTPQTGYLMIPAAAFTPVESSAVYTNGGQGVGSTGIACFTAPVNLPQGAKMTRLVMWYAKDDSVVLNSAMTRVAMSSAIPQNIVTMSFSDSDGAYKATAVNISDPSLQTVNNARYAYFITRCLSDMETSYGARITYTYKTAGD